ncbi:MAG: sensor histidine kinase [Firmicutes bacterium]|nr:sensor histidine kinase [Bacillota bacterium]
MADRRKLERAIYNLVHNGIQYNGPGGRVTVAVAPEPGAVRITVADTGPGIPPEDLPYIFDRFYRREPSRSRGHGGAGLGLAIAREIVESHLGAIQVESRPGEGTRFAVVLPRS